MRGYCAPTVGVSVVILVGNGDIPRFLANGDRLGRRTRLPRVDPLCSLKVARASKIAGRQFSAAARRKPTGLLVCKNGCAGMHRGGPYWLPPRRAPFGRRAGQPSEGAPTGTARLRVLASAAGPHLPLLGEESRASKGSARTRTLSLAIYSTPGDIPRWLDEGERSCGSWRRRRAGRSSGQRGRDRIGWYACPRLTLFATEWSAARRKPVRAAAMHFGAANFCRRSGP